MSRLTAKPSTSAASKGQPRDRDPPPALFLHPSREASHASLPGAEGRDGVDGVDTSSAYPQQQQQQQQQQQHKQKQKQQPPPSQAGGAPTAAITAAETKGTGRGRGTEGTSAPLTRTTSTTASPPSQQQQQRTRHHLPPPPSLPLTTLPPPPTTVPRLPTGDSTRTTRTTRTTTATVRTADRTDALWAEMQATLEDVELSAGSGGTRVFGPDHDRALAELRAAQIALAQAWARSEADDAIETSSSIVTGGAGPARRPPHNVGVGSDTAEVQNLKGALGEIGVAAASPASAAAAGTGSAGVPSTGSPTVAATAAAATASAVKGAVAGVGGTTSAATAPGGAGGDHYTDAGRSAAGGGTTTRPGSSSAAGTATGGIGAERLGAKLVQETQTDILHARKRREANDRYFGRVDQGVRDVVARLGEVAAAMRAVEQETRDVWGSDSDSSDEGSVAGSAKA
ncbi:hypothetical protein SLS62_006596 [Diatrype stigma]|uniref:Uncharacterized protein n=1 Tax=Diatrype stigma TaxID=117547 RepID=A0AAN9UMG5_9PEZI